MPDLISAIAESFSAIAAIALTFVAAIQLQQVQKQIAEAATQLKQTKIQIDLARRQLENARDAEKRKNTLEVCQRFEKDPQLKSAMQNIWNKSENGTDYTVLDPSDEFDVLTVLNYFDGIAIGILQEIMVEEMAKDFIGDSLEKAVKAFIKGESGPGWKAAKSQVSSDGFGALMKIYAKWFPPESPRFKNK